MLKNNDSSINKKIEDLCTTFLELHKAFMDEATIAAEITALQTLDNRGIISNNVGEISREFDGM
jgi:hypothetical protein